MSPSRTDGAKKPARLRGAENRSRALALRIAGASTPEIAAELGITRQHAWRLIDTAARGLAAEITDRAEEWRAIQAARIEEDIARLRGEAHGGNLPAYSILVRLYARQSRLLNLDLRPPASDEAPAVFTVITALPWERSERPDYIIDAPALTSGDDAAGAQMVPDGGEVAS